MKISPTSRVDRRRERIRSRFLSPLLRRTPSIRLWRKGKRRSASFREPMRKASPTSNAQLHVRCRVITGSMGRHRPNLLPILKNPFASRRRLEFCRPRSTRRPPAGTLVVRVEDLVYAGVISPASGPPSAIESTCLGLVFGLTVKWPAGCVPTPFAFGKRNVFRSVIRTVFRNTLAGTGRPFTTPRVNCHVPDSLRNPSRRQQIARCAARSAVCATSAIATTAPIARVGITLIIHSFCIENRRLSSPA